MPLSISSSNSSNDRLPHVGNREFLAAIVCFIALLLVAELIVRSVGMLPSVADSKLLWSMHRHKARGSKVVAIIGSSRSQLGIDPEHVGLVFPGYRVVHLAIDGTPPFAVLKDLAEDENFDGIIVCDAFENFVLPDVRGIASPWVRHYHDIFSLMGTWQKRFDTWCQVRLQTHFAVLSPAMGLASLLERGPYLSYIHMKPSRYRAAEYLTRMSAEQLTSHRNKRVVDLENHLAKSKAVLVKEYRQMLHTHLLPLYDKLRARNANLVIVRMPTTGKSWSAMDAFFPKSKYWDSITDETGIPTIHFQDYSVLSKYDCPDTSHLDAKDAPEFTVSLMRYVSEVICDASAVKVRE